MRENSSGSTLPAPCSVLTVDVTTLDDFFTRTSGKADMNGTTNSGPHLLKIDVEGHELAVLEGAQRTLETRHPALLIECEARHRGDGDVRTVFNFVESLGYIGSFFHEGKRRPLAEFNATIHQHCSASQSRLPPGYVNNFAFEHHA